MGVGTRGVEENQEVRFGLQTNPESRIEFSLIKIGVRQLVKRTLDVVLENIWSIDGWTVLIRFRKIRSVGIPEKVIKSISKKRAWDRFNDLLRACPHHGFSELHKLDTFYNALKANDQDSLNSTAGGNFLDKIPRECLRIIESKSKVRNSRNKAVITKVSSNSSTPGISPDVAALTTEVSELKNLMKTMLIDKQKVQAPATVKAVEQSCVTCGGTHSYKNCPAIDGNVYQDNIQDQIVTNPREHVNAITTRSGKTYEGPSTPLVPTPIISIPSKEPKQNPETSMDKVQKPSSESTAQVPPPEEEDSIFIEIPKPKAKKTVNVEIQDLNSPRPNSYQSKLPYPERMKSTTHSDDPSPSSSSVKTSDNLKKFTDELTPLNSLPSGDDVSILKRDSQEGNFQVHSNPLFEFDDNFKSSIINPLFYKMEEDVEIKNSNIYNDLVLRQTPLSDKGECFDLGDDTDEIDAFLAMEISMDYEEGYYDSEEDCTIFPKSLSDPLHQSSPEKSVLLPSRNDREFEEYLSLMTVLCEISTSRSQKNVHANQSSIIESLPVSSITVEDSEPVQEEIDIFLVPDDLILPGVENDDSEDEDNELPNLDHQDDLSIPRPPPEPSDVEKCLEPEAELHQLDTFYNALNANDQDSLNSAAGGNFLDKMPRECLRIIESKSKVRNSRNKAVVAKVSSNSSTPGISPDVAALTTEVSELKNLMKTMLIDKQKVQAPATVKAVEQSCVTCGGTHSYKNCPATDGNVYQDNIQEYVSQAAAANFNQGNTNSRPPMIAN
ncbi:hypothetical protein Tco_0797977 [Tanacetum coccineum]